MKIDFKAAIEAEARQAEKGQEAFDKYMDEKKESHEAQQAENYRLLAKVYEQENDRNRQEMEAKIAAETEAAEKKIKAQYAKKYGAHEWNESPYEAELRKLSQMLHK